MAIDQNDGHSLGFPLATVSGSNLRIPPEIGPAAKCHSYPARCRPSGRRTGKLRAVTLSPKQYAPVSIYRDTVGLGKFFPKEVPRVPIKTRPLRILKINILL